MRNMQDRKSWGEFVDLYGPLILRYLRRCGVAERDALDLVQDVLKIVARHIGRFEYDKRRSFRAWLRKIATHRAYKFFAEQGRRPAAPGGTTHLEAIQALPAASDETDDWVEEEWRKRRLEQAMMRVRREVKETTWKVFELRYLHGIEPAEVADRLKIEIGSVYTSLSRVLKRLREAVEEIDESS